MFGLRNNSKDRIRRKHPDAQIEEVRQRDYSVKFRVAFSNFKGSLEDSPKKAWIAAKNQLRL